MGTDSWSDRPDTLGKEDESDPSDPIITTFRYITRNDRWLSTAPPQTNRRQLRTRSVFLTAKMLQFVLVNANVNTIILYQK